MKAITLTSALYDYLHYHQTPLDPLFSELRAETARRPDAAMQISPDQGQFMHQMVKITSARQIIEIGCYTGYSTLCMALGLGQSGRLWGLDINPETTAVAQRYLDQAGVGDKVKFLLGPALTSLRDLKKEVELQSIDLVFIDADKENYLNYYQEILPMVRSNGLILVDNVLWSGAVTRVDDQTAETVAIRQFNDYVIRDQRVEGGILNIADGLYFLRKK